VFLHELDRFGLICFLASNFKELIEIRPDDKGSGKIHGWSRGERGALFTQHLGPEIGGVAHQHDHYDHGVQGHRRM